MKTPTKLKLLLLPALIASAVWIFAKNPDHGTHHNPSHEALVYEKEKPLQEVAPEREEKPEKVEPQWQSYTLKEKDNFSTVGLSQLALSSPEILQITSLAKNHIDLSQLQAGMTINYLMNSQEKLDSLRLKLAIDRDYLIKREDKQFNGQEVKKASTRVHQIYKGEITNSLGSDLRAQGISNALATKAGQLLEKKNDLRRHLRTGDQFELLIASNEVEGTLYAPKIEAIKLTGQRINTEIYRHSDGIYYDKEGKSLEHGFKRYPLEKPYRVSSSFNLQRKHPLTGKVRPHHGTDFATPIGTPVISPAQGTVIRADYQQFAGNYLDIEHFNGFITRYFHLSKTLVKAGDKVNMGDKIALTGNTGQTTGAHLHYEIHKNNKAVDAMLVSLPKSRNLAGKELSNFLAGVSSKVALLNNESKNLAKLEEPKPSKPPQA